jgi:6-phosphogluconolactonase
MQITTRFHAVSDAHALTETAHARVLSAAERALARDGVFSIVLAGGETPRALYRSLRDAATPWERWQFYFGDERCVPVSEPGRNSRMAAEALLDHVPVPRENVHALPAEIGPVEGARVACARLQSVGVFDLVLLGLGEDGHTASLFPAHDWGSAQDAPDALAVLDAPKPPPERVSLSAGRLSRAREVLFLVQGEAKRGALERWRRGEVLPAAAIRPAAGVDVLVTAGVLSPERQAGQA